MTFSAADMRSRLVRYEDLIPCKTAFIDARSPGSDQKENFTIIGPGVAENPDQHIHVKIPHGFNIGGARQPKGCVNSQHSHESEEVFLVHAGEWAFRWGEHGEDGEVILKAGDVISIPIHVFRGFECVSDSPGFLFAILGRDDPGHVMWAPYVFEEAAKHGLVLLESGRLVDTAAGEAIPDGEVLSKPTTAEEAASLRRLTLEEMQTCVVTLEELVLQADTALARRSQGVAEASILGPSCTAEGALAGKVSIDHGFQFRCLEFQPGGMVPLHTRSEEEVLFVHEGALTILWDSESIELRKGDTFTTPIGLARAFKASKDGATVFTVRRGNAPKAPVWQESLSGAAAERPGKIAAL